MDGEAPNQETNDSTEMTHQTDTNNNNQSDVPGQEDNKETETEHTKGETAGGQGSVEAVGEREEATAPQQGGGEESSTGDTDKPQVASKPVEGDTEVAVQDKDKAATDMTEPKPGNGENKGQGEVEDNLKGGQVEEVKSGNGSEEVKDKNKDEEKSIPGEDTKEKDKNASAKTAKDAETKKQVKEDAEMRDKAKVKEVEKQGKPKRKSGPPPSSLSRPRPSARSVRASTKNSIIAKFEQAAPESPLPRNFKIQRSSAAMATGASIKQKMLQWCRNKTRKYEGINIENFSSSWCDGLAFCALIHRFFPNAFDYSSLNADEREKNFTLAFQTAESLADCCPLLEVSDMLMMGEHPDPMCVFTYVQSLCHSLSKIEKERKEKEKEGKEKSGTEGEEEDKGEATVGEEAAGEPSAEMHEEQSAVGEKEEEEAAEPEQTGSEEAAPPSCETEEDGAALIETES
ncbi:smoothelin-like 1 [Echeneis naucrates]|uniref:Calponin-homology (CH) domain-containing protein n=1 Tax=Echeneis naucrates TaxID=173247 RepID=A0A665TNQ8_ECHNA|nr:smoothelin-like protein 1 [Echeneis naucrates]